MDVFDAGLLWKHFNLFVSWVSKKCGLQMKVSTSARPQKYWFIAFFWIFSSFRTELCSYIRESCPFVALAVSPNIQDVFFFDFKAKSACTFTLHISLLNRPRTWCLHHLGAAKLPKPEISKIHIHPNAVTLKSLNRASPRWWQLRVRSSSSGTKPAHPRLRGCCFDDGSWAGQGGCEKFITQFRRFRVSESPRSNLKIMKNKIYTKLYLILNRTIYIFYAKKKGVRKFAKNQW
jgi:hypothetical protein